MYHLVIEKKKELDEQKIYNWNNSKFQKHLLEIINTKHKESKSETISIKFKGNLFS